MQISCFAISEIFFFACIIFQVFASACGWLPKVLNLFRLSDEFTFAPNNIFYMVVKQPVSRVFLEPNASSFIYGNGKISPNIDQLSQEGNLAE